MTVDDLIGLEILESALNAERKKYQALIERSEEWNEPSLRAYGRSRLQRIEDMIAENFESKQVAIVGRKSTFPC